MTKRQIALALMVVGGVTTVIGLVMWLGSGSDAGPLAAATTTTAVPTTTAIAEGGTTSTSNPATTTSVAPTTTTTIGPAVSIAEFVVEFAAAIDRGDVDHIYAALHPSVPELFGAAQCRQFIEDEILLLVDYRLVGDVEGPEPQTVAGNAVDMYRADAAFGFQGQQFESEAGFALVEGTVRWFTTCD